MKATLYEQSSADTEQVCIAIVRGGNGGAAAPIF